MRNLFLSFLLVPLLLTGERYVYQLAVALMFQNEADHLKEWIEYHKLVGVEHFYLFDNLSTDGYEKVLEPYLASGEVELYHFPNPSNTQKEYLAIQKNIYNHALMLARGKVKWLSCIDADEYLVPLDSDSILKELEPFEKYGGVYINWLNFGTSHVEKIPEDRLLIETLLHCSGSPSHFGKSIVRPERVFYCQDPHIFNFHSPYFHVSTDFRWVPYMVSGYESDKKMLVFHYYTGDLDYLKNIKFPRRRKWIPGLTLDAYIESQEPLNSTYNDTMLRFASRLREKVF